MYESNTRLTGMLCVQQEPNSFAIWLVGVGLLASFILDAEVWLVKFHVFYMFI